VIKRVIPLLLLFVAAQASCVNAEKNFEGLKIVKDAAYVPGGHETQRGDIYRPDTDETLPGIVLVHGGGFVVGSKDWLHYPEVAARLARGGYVVYTINYRLLDHGGVYPENIADVNCAIRWFRENSKEFGADPDKTGVIGSSAGGYLSLMGGYTSGGKYELDDCPAKERDSSVDAVVDYFGITDMRQFSKGKGRILMERLFGGSIEDRPEMFREASPINHLNGAPPTLIIHGTNDKLVAYSQSAKLYAAMKKNEQEAWLLSFEGAGHGFINDLEGPEGSKSLDMSLAFFDMLLKNGPSCVDEEAGLFVCE